MKDYISGVSRSDKMETRKRKTNQNGGTSEATPQKRTKVGKSIRKSREKTETMDSSTGKRQHILTTDIKEASKILTSPRKNTAKLKIDDTGTEIDESSLWKYCIRSKDAEKIKILLRKGSRPDPETLQYAYVKFGKENTELMKEICLTIEEHITSKYDNIVSTHACYKDNRESQIVFVVLTSKANDHLLDIEYPFHLVGLDDYDGDKVIERERLQELLFDGDEYEELTDCLQTNSPDLMEKHSNLTNTSISHFKSSKKHGLKKTSCIVFYVFAKGYIPIGEERLPSYLKSKTKRINTDIREGRFAEANGGPADEHKDLKIGCRIESSKEPGGGGTIGGFVNHPEHGLCAITCAHVVLKASEVRALYKKRMNVTPLIGIQCFQPKPPLKCGTVVDIKLFSKGNKTGGMDIAFVKVDDSRKPRTKHFPDVFEEDVERKCPCIDAFLSRTLRFSPADVVQRPKELREGRQVLKYGSTSKLTTGVFSKHAVSCTLALEDYDEDNGRFKYTYFLTDQIEIHDDKMKFSTHGDSGAMVYIKDGNNELTALGILTGRKDKDRISYVTPLWNVFKEIKSPIPFALAEINPVRQSLERLDRLVESLKMGLEV